MLKLLNTAASGLNAAKTVVENISNNIANVNTPGYKKRVVQLNELNINGSRFTGGGVKADEVYRITSQYVYNNLINENSKLNYLNKVASILGNIETMFQETKTSGFSNNLNRYFQSVENLRSNPNSEIFRTAYKNQGKILVDSLKNLYSNIEKEEKLTRISLKENVVKINNIIKRIGSINQQLGQHNIASNDLLDKRDRLEKELSKYVDIDVDRSNGEYELKIGGTTVINNTNVRNVTIVENDTIQIDRFATTDASNNVIDNIIGRSSNGLQTGAIVTYKLNNEFEVSVKMGDSVVDANGNPVDLGNGNNIINNTNYIRALAYKINHDANISASVHAYNGNYSLDANGNKVEHTSTDKFLLIESKIKGEEHSFEGRISIVEANPTSGDITRNTVFKDKYQSKEAKNNVNLAIFERKINIKSGIIKAQIENLTTDAVNNKLVGYKNKLDDFARSLSDMYDKYIKTGNDKYIYGHVASDEYNGSKPIKHINLFSGADVKSLKFNQNAVNDLLQSDLDYMSKMQWKKDVEFDGFAQDASSRATRSFSEFYQEIRVNISSDKENNGFLHEAQNAVSHSLESTFDKLTKVDSDKEMINLMKFQAAYTANAKIITVADKMLQTILGIR